MAEYATGYSGYGQGGGGGYNDEGYDYGNQPPYEQQPYYGGGGQDYSPSVDESGNPRTIYVGNLDPTVTEDFITTLFSQIGPVNKCKIIWEGGTEPYAFVEFMDHNAASQALTAMNRRVLLGREMKVNWATQPGGSARADGANKWVDTSKHFHVFVGDLSPEVDNKALKDAFAPFGDISDAKVIRDLQTLKSKGYGFVSFVGKEDAERAIEQMNGQWLGRRTIRTNWATRKPAGAKQMNFDEVYQQTGPQNATVYVGGISPTASEDDLRKVFAKFGTIMEIRIFKQQGYSFVRYDNKDSATHAICNLNGADVNGQSVRCSWGRAGQEGAGQTGPYGYGYGYGGGGAPGGQNAQYWQQYYAQYYNNPAMMQQWQNYWQQQGQ